MCSSVPHCIQYFISIRFRYSFPFLYSAALSHGFIPAYTAAGIGEKAVVLAAAAVLIPSGDDDFLQRLELEQTTPLDHIVADAKTVKKVA